MADVQNYINIGDIVSGLDPSEMVEIRKISPFASKKLVEGITVQSRHEIKRPLTDDELSKLVRIRGTNFTFDGDPSIFLLGAEALRIKIAHQFDPLFAVNSSIVDPLPHQIEAVYRYILPLPRIRFILADDTGAGKTIMAGLLIKELMFRGVIKKILIITPGGLTKQWKEEELQEKFGLSAWLINRQSFETEPGQFSRYDEGLFVVSIDFIARNEGCLKAAEETQWDMIIVDEAHKLSAYEYGSKLEEGERYKAVKALSKKTDHLLFLTATPHRGRKDTFRRLLMLLDEDLFQKDEHVTDKIREQSDSDEFDSEKPITKARNRFFLRRLKEEMVDWNNVALFKPRHTKTVGYELTPEEQQLYNEVTSYVRAKRKEAKVKKNRNVELMLMVMQRRLASSIYAITRTLEKRFNTLTEVLNILRDSTLSLNQRRQKLNVNDQTEEDPRNIFEYEDLDDDEREKIDRTIFRHVLTDDPEKVAEERAKVEELLILAQSLKEHKETKFLELLKVLDSSDVIRSDDEKLIIFTEHRDTLENLSQRLVNKGYHVSNIHGGMDVDMRKKAQRDFRIKSKIMIATDAAGEGINLQFCRYLINWDIPWNPNRLEQRMGRIHRYGQLEDVHVYNLVARNTREGAVLEKVLSKLDIMREQMGTDRVYDVISDWLEDISLVDLIENALDTDDISEIEKRTNTTLNIASEQKAQTLVALQKKISLTSKLDLKSARNLRDASDERKLQPLFIQRFFEKAWIACGGTIYEDKNFPVWHIGSTPVALIDIAKDKRIAISQKYDVVFAFDKLLLSVASKAKIPEQTKLMGPGHPLFDTLIEWAIRDSHQSFTKGAVVIDPNISQPHKLWLIRSVIEDGRVEKHKRIANEKLVIIISDNLGFRSTSPSYFLNCLAPNSKLEIPDIKETSNDEIQVWSYEQITEKQLKEVTEHRNEECTIRRNYLNDAFRELILELQNELNELQQAQLFGDDNIDEQRHLEQRISELKIRKAERLAELELMLKLSANLPDLITQAIVSPDPGATIEIDNPSKGMAMRRDDEVEKIAMETAMRYEKSRGWNPVDVSLDCEHYDIRSEGLEGEKRFIEVKGRAQSGPVMLTGPELDKLKQLGERAWLYIVTYCKGEKPHLRIIQDPISKLNPDMLYRQIQFLIKEPDWINHSHEIEI